MKTHLERNRRIDALRELMERFDAPDLTLTEAKDLRSRLDALLERQDFPETPTGAGSAPGRPVPSARIQEWDDAPWPGAFSPCGAC